MIIIYRRTAFLSLVTRVYIFILSLFFVCLRRSNHNNNKIQPRSGLTTNNHGRNPWEEASLEYARRTSHAAAKRMAVCGRYCSYFYCLHYVFTVTFFCLPKRKDQRKGLHECQLHFEFVALKPYASLAIQRAVRPAERETATATLQLVFILI